MENNSGFGNDNSIQTNSCAFLLTFANLVLKSFFFLYRIDMSGIKYLEYCSIYRRLFSQLQCIIALSSLVLISEKLLVTGTAFIHVMNFERSFSRPDGYYSLREI